MYKDKRKEAEKRREVKGGRKAIGEVALAGAGGVETKAGSAFGQHLSGIGHGDHHAPTSQPRFVTEQMWMHTERPKCKPATGG